ncbi:hypothetical protein OO013_15785 [Mangrovivirga sp. M17]|uniref:Metal-dependent hydrolase n=1 Tax=Mangrovivirga halotolerans TaxID=2993936 RepID=A0ABT3RU86_9BACT|nr:hypothetical protein [Mangrovivirga halotolerans]MCX2745339.1 hypothetical protein [Mangrovivirga halotolerans]
MNVIFHIAAGTAIIAGHSNFRNDSLSNQVKLSITGFTLGVISHGILDYSPHCYPINSKWDAIVGLILILFALWKSRMKWISIVGFIYLGSLFPDLVDLSPGILNGLTGINLPEYDNIFPWHYHEYSGSIYNGDCEVSSVNHFLTILFCGLTVWLNRRGVRDKVFKNSTQP